MKIIKVRGARPARRVPILSLLTALLVLGCGASRIIVNVDVVSFMVEADANPTYGEDFPIPPGLPPVSLRVGPSTVEIPEGLGEVTEILDADLDFRASVDNQTGSGELEVRLFLAAEGDDLFAQGPAATFHLTLAPGAVDVVEERVVLTEPARSLLADATLQFGYELKVDGSGSSENLLGAVHMEVISIRVVHDPNLGA